MPKRSVIGKEGKAKVIEIFAVVSNTDMEEGRGSAIDLTYHPNKEQAQTAAIGEGTHGADAGVEPRRAVRFADGTLLLLAGANALPADGAPKIHFSKPTPQQIAKARVALAQASGSQNLSSVERAALGT